MGIAPKISRSPLLGGRRAARGAAVAALPVLAPAVAAAELRPAVLAPAVPLLPVLPPIPATRPQPEGAEESPGVQGWGRQGRPSDQPPTSCGLAMPISSRRISSRRISCCPMPPIPDRRPQRCKAFGDLPLWLHEI